MPRSMTGFARQETQHSWGALICEIRSVNHRYLEPSFRLQDNLRHVEAHLREVLRQRLQRGKIDIVMQINHMADAIPDIGLNLPLAQKIAALATQVGKELNQAAPLNSLDILKWPGVLQTQQVNADELQEAAQQLFDAALAQLISNREREGKELHRLIEQRLQAVEAHVVSVRTLMPKLLAAQEERLNTKLQALAVDIDEDRLAQEVVYLAQKADVAEELDRLVAHVAEVRHTLEQKNAMGRRLDFLMQELNREANTLSSKSLASEVSQIAVDLKVLIEQMREQVQNIE